MAVVGRIAAIWRYPVKSMRGEELASCSLGSLGIPGDRAWALRDEEAREMRGGKKWPVLMQCQARYREEPAEDTIPAVDLELPGRAPGDPLGSDSADINQRLSELVGTPVTLWPRRPAEDREHYRRHEKRSAADLRGVLGLEPGDPFPDLSSLPAEVLIELREFTSPRGTYFDAFPLHFLTTSWLDVLSQHNAGSRFEALRFRPNFLIEGAEPGLVELGWCGKRLRIGGAEISCVAPTLRCSMTIQQTGDLPKDPQVLRTIVRNSQQNVGAYARVTRPGTLRVGDPVELL